MEEDKTSNFTFSFIDEEGKAINIEQNFETSQQLDQTIIDPNENKFDYVEDVVEVSDDQSKNNNKDVIDYNNKTTTIKDEKTNFDNAKDADIVINNDKVEEKIKLLNKDESSVKLTEDEICKKQDLKRQITYTIDRFKREKREKYDTLIQAKKKIEFIKKFNKEREKDIKEQFKIENKEYIKEKIRVEKFFSSMKKIMNEFNRIKRKNNSKPSIHKNKASENKTPSC